MKTYLYKIGLICLLFGISASAVFSQIIIPATGSNTVLCGTNVTLCEAGGCAGNYPAGADGFTVFRATGSATITFSGTFDTETDSDFIILYDGIGTTGTQIFTGSGPGGTFNYTGAPGQSITVRFISDPTIQAGGVNFTVTYGGVCGSELPLPLTGSAPVQPCGTNNLLVDNGGPAGNYGNNADGTITFTNSGASSINITGTYATEAGFDFIRIYDGVGTGGTLLQSVSGTGNFIFSSLPGQTVTLRFQSDANNNAAGFDFSVSYSGPCVCPTFTATATPNIGCSPASSQLFVNNIPANAYTVSTIPFAPFSCAGGTAGPTGDDAASPTITLPFTFLFYGTAYTQLGIATNGNIQLGAGPYNTAFTSTGPIPATNINNMIALNYSDWMANNGGTISYQTQGTAPNRRFIVCYNNMVPFGFPLPDPGLMTGQIVLYEGSNIIDFHITTNTMPTYSSQTQGLQATNGVGVGVGGRNYANWTGVNTSVRFNPNATYLWSPAATLNSTTIQNPLATNVTSTTNYTVTATYAGCSSVSSVLFTVNPTPTVTVSPSITAICGGQPAILTAGGANTYLWSNGATTASITASPASSTIFTVTGTTASGCTSTASSTVNVGPNVTVSNYSICQGATVPAGQGLGFTATFPAATNTVQNSTTVGGAIYNRLTTITPCALSAVGTAVNYATTTFTPSFTGSYTIRSCGTTPANWDMFTTIYQNSFNPASPCVNVVALGDDGGTGCTNGNNIVVTLTAGVPYIIVNTSFNNGTTGAYQVTIIPPTPPTVTRTWFNVPSGGSSLGTNSPFNPVGVAGSGLANTNTAGTYTFYADANGCRVPVDFVINPAPTPTITGTLAICAGTSTTLTASGGSSYLWNTGATTSAITVSPATNTTYTVTATSAGCTASTSSTVTVTAAPTASISGTNIICAGTSTTLTASGGSTYLWNTGATTAVITPSPATNTTYSVTVSLGGSCTASTSSTVTVTALPTANISGTNVICAGTSTTLTASGGSSYLWNTGATTAVITPSPATNTTYSVTVSLGGSCTASTSSTVTVTPLPTPSISGTNVICAGASTTLTASGGSSYLWNTGATTAAITPSPAANTTYTVTATSAGCTASTSSTVTVTPLPTPSISGTTTICAGTSTTLTASGGSTYLWNTGATTAAITPSPAVNTTYTVTATNAGCTASTSSTVTVTPLPTPSISGTTTICAGTSTTLTASGGNTYLWNTGATTAAITPSPAANTTYTVTATSAGCTATASSTVTVTPLPTPSITGTNVICAGTSTTLTASGGSSYLWNTGATTAAITPSPAANTTYTVTATSAGCTATASSTVTVTPLPTPSISGTTTICAGTSTTLTASGGSTYLWNTGATTAAITPSPAANTTYTVTATNAGCTASTSSTVTVTPLPTPSITGTNVICAGASTTLTASGGSSYLWNTGATTAAITPSPAANTTYTVTATSAGCTATASSTVTVTPLPTPSITGTNIICAGASTTLTASGGSSYLWNTGATTSAITVSPAANTTYTVTATSAGCSATANNTVTVSSNPTITLASNNVLCNGGNTGSINSSIAGGTGTFTYVWSNAATTANISGLGIGTYSVTVSNNICTASQSATITQPSALSLSVASSTNAGCGALANGGSVNITIAGGTNPYRFLWSNGATSQNIANLVVGNYIVTVSDNNNCNTTVSQNITSGGIAAQLVSAVDTICFGTNTGAITATATPSAGASFVWSNGATGTSINNLVAGTYTVTATNVNAGITCTDVLTVVVRQPAANLATIVSEVQPLDCSGNDVAELSNTATGGWGGYQYDWSNGGQSSNIAGIGAGDYTVTVTDAQGCQTTATGNIATIVIPQVDAWVVSVGANSATVDVGTIVNINAGNNQAGVSYVWTPNTNVLAPNSAATTITANDAGTFIYTVVATAGNCSDTDSIELIVRAAFLGMPTAFTPNGDGENDFFRPAQLNTQYIKSFRIFNRWGEMIYDNADISNGGWDGTYKGALQPRDAYIYFLEYQLPQDAEPIKLRGEFTLVR